MTQNEHLKAVLDGRYTRQIEATATLHLMSDGSVLIGGVSDEFKEWARKHDLVVNIVTPGDGSTSIEFVPVVRAADDCGSPVKVTG